MVKKISALVLALVLCLSVVVVPASAGVELGDDTFAIALEWDKSSYKAGDTAYLSVYADGADDMSFYTGTITFGVSSEVFDPAVHTTAYLKENTETADWFNTYYKAAADGAISQLATTVANNVTNANTAEEKALYDWYVKIGFAKNSAGSHENVGTTKNGFYGSDFNPDEPLMVIAFTVREDVADGTAVRAAVTSGTFLKPSATAPSTGIKYYKNPGNATTTANVASSAIAISQADTMNTNGEVLIGEAGPEFPATSIVNPLKGQIRFHSNDAGEYAGSYDIRALARIEGDDFAATFKNEATAKEMIKEVGFVFASGSNVAAPSAAAVMGLVENGTAAEGYTKKTVNFISRNAGIFGQGNYGFSCVVIGMTDADYDNSLVAVGYIAYEVDGVMTYAYYPAAQTVSFAELFDAQFGNAFPNA